MDLGMGAISKAIWVSKTANRYKKDAGQRVTLDSFSWELAHPDGGVLWL